MNFLENILQGNMMLAWITLVIAFFILAKSADIFVDRAVDLACVFKIPKLIIGIVLVSLATTAPELSVSLISAIREKPEMALGNAIGSVICNSGLALGLAGLMTAGYIHVMPSVLKLSGTALFIVQAVLLLFILPDLTLSRSEGAGLILLFAVYLYLLMKGHKSGKFNVDQEIDEPHKTSGHSTSVIVMIFAGSLLGILFASELVVTSATVIAVSFGVPEAMIALTLVALGTSIPEIATCVVSVRKGHGAVAVGNIIGANILNICWVAGASAMANDLSISRREFYFMFPAMFIFVAVKLGLLWAGKRVTRTKGAILIAMYLAYIASFFIIFIQR